MNLIEKAWKLQYKIENWWKNWPWKKRKEFVFLGFKSLFYIFCLYMLSVNGLKVQEDGTIYVWDLFLSLVFVPIYFSILIFLLPSILENKIIINNKYLIKLIRIFKRRN